MAKTNHFAEGGVDYVLHRPTYSDELASALAAQCNQTEHALDVSCGSRQLSVLLAKHVARVTATDPSQSQLDHALLHPKVAYTVEPTESIGLP